MKSPWFCDHAQEILGRKDIVIDHVFVPMRDVFDAAESRRQVYLKNMARLSVYKRISRQIKYLTRPSKITKAHFDGGLVHTRSLKTGDQEQILLKQLYNLMLALSGAHIPVTLMHYPTMMNDPAYLYQRLEPVLGRVSQDDFSSSFDRTVRRDLVHVYHAQ